MEDNVQDLTQAQPGVGVQPGARRLPDIKVTLERRDGKWRVRVGEGAVPELFDTFGEAVEAITHLRLY